MNKDDGNNNVHSKEPKIMAFMMIPLFSLVISLNDASEISNKAANKETFIIENKLFKIFAYQEENQLFKEKKQEIVPFVQVVSKETSDDIQKVIIPEEAKKTNVVKKNNSAANEKILNPRLGIPGPILSDVRIVGGKNICKNPNDKPRKSKKNSNVHVDAECCLDPDEIPNSNCYYSPEKYGSLINRYLKGKK